MPCYDAGPIDRQPERFHGLTGHELEAALCALMTVLEDCSTGDRAPLSANHIADALDRVDWKEAGITRKQLTDWWKSHKAADKVRRDREQLQREDAERKAMLRKSGLEKLTPAERLALGIN